MKYGRDDESWDRMTAAGTRFLEERARMGLTTSYTELNTVLVQRTGCAPFDFDQASERAAVGHLLGRIVEDSHPRTGLMLSALVQYLDANDAGPGFYQLAQQMALLDRRADRDAKEAFWVGQVTALHEHYGGSHPASNRNT